MKPILTSISGALISLALAGSAFAAPLDMAAVCQKATGQEPTRDEAAVKAFNQEYPKIQVNYLRLVSGRSSARYATEKGDDYLKKLAAQQPVWVASVVSSTQQLAAGELPVVAPNVRTVVSPLKNDGASIDFIEPALTTGVEFATVVSKTMESPNAARCLYNFLFTNPGQVAFAFGDSYWPFGSLDGGLSLPTDYVSPVEKEVAADAPTILALLGLQ